MNIADQINLVRQNIEQCCQTANRPLCEVKLLAVSKTHPASAIQQAYESGITQFGESYLQESLEKINQCKDLNITWHFIGPIQSNKTRPIAENFDWVQSVDRVKIVNRLNEQRPSTLPPLNICIQANLFNEPQKKGAKLEELESIITLANSLPNINAKGLMVIPPPQQEINKQLEQFALVKTIFDNLQQKFHQLDTLSMGMSGDIQAAIASGSTMVRVGTGIFGARKTA